MTLEKSTSERTAEGKEGTTATATSAGVETAHPNEERASATSPPVPHSPVNSETPSNLPPKSVPQKLTTTAKPVTGGKAVVSSEAIADKNSTPAAHVEPQPSLPVSMIVKPESPSSGTAASLFPGELEESFDSALARVERARNSLAARIWGGIRVLIPWGNGGGHESINVQRMVAFDGFRSDLFEDKRERDRRYGTVYRVSEEVNAFLVRLELPRRMPESSLKQTWEVPDEMPDYACTLQLTDNVLLIRAGLPDEARRRLSYVSSSFPTDFETRIEFHTPVEGYKHRLRNKVLEIVVNKKAGPASRLQLQRRQD